MNTDQCRKVTALIVAAAAMIAACLVAGCGSGDSYSVLPASEQYEQKVYIIGEIADPSGGTAEGPAYAVRQVFVNRVAYDGTSTDAPIFMAADQALSLDDTTKQGILNTYRNGFPIIIVRGNEAEINAVLGILEFEENFTLPENFPYAELFAIDSDERGKFTWAMYPPGATEADSVPEAYVDDSTALLNRTGMFRDWMKQNGSRMTPELESFERDAQHALAAEGAGDSGQPNLRELAEVYQQVKTFTDPVSGNNYQLIFNIYSCHSFSYADGKNYDWFYVEQNGTMNGTSGYKGIQTISYFEIPGWGFSGEGYWWWGIYEVAHYYIGSYDMSSSMMSQGGDKSDRSVTLETHNPDTVNNQTTTRSGVSFNINGTLGFKAGSMGADANGSVTGGLTVSHDDTVTISDCTVQNMCTASGYMDEARWLYTFKKMTQYGWLAVFCKLNSPVPLSTSTFAPYNKWIWKFSPDVRNGKKSYKNSFTTKLDVENMVTLTTWAAAWFPVSDPQHLSKVSHFTDTVQLSYPPLIVAPSLNVNFSAEGQVKYMDVIVASDWSASSNQTWCQAVPTTGKADNPQVSITVSPNNTGKERKATVTFTTADGKGKDTMTVTQSQY